MTLVLTLSVVLALVGVASALFVRRPALAVAGFAALPLAVAVMCVAFGLYAIAAFELGFAVLVVFLRGAAGDEFSDPRQRIRSSVAVIAVALLCLPLLSGLEDSFEAFGRWALPPEDGTTPDSDAALLTPLVRQSLVFAVGLVGAGIAILLAQRHWLRIWFGGECVVQGACLAVAAFAWSRGETASPVATTFVAVVLCLRATRLLIARDILVHVAREFASTDADEADLARS